MIASNIIMSKRVDWSAFTSGFNVPVEMQPTLYALLGRTLARNRPEFNRRKLRFEFPNGAVEPVGLNLHLAS